MATIQTITDAAYRKCGIKSPDATASAEALEYLNNMLSTWGLDFVIPYVTREHFDLVIGQRTYTVGSGGNFDTTHPFEIEKCFLRDADDHDHHVSIIGSGDFDKVRDKDTSRRPTQLYYIPEYPLGKVRFDSKPLLADEAHFEVWKHLTEFASLTTTLTLPNEYKEAFIYNLAIKLAEDNSLDLPPSIANTAVTSLLLLSRARILSRLPGIANLGFSTGFSSHLYDGYDGS